jgi:ribosome maturation factor RimP
MIGQFGRIVAVAVAIVLCSSTMSLAGGDKQTGTIVAVAEEVVKFKGADGKTYEVKAADVVAEDLKTGDVVEYEIAEGMPVKVTKKKH